MTDDRFIQKNAVRRAVGGVLFNVSNFPERAQAKLWGSNMGPLNEKITDAVLGALAEMPTPTDDERGALAINYCPEHGDLLNRPDGTEARSHRCRNAHKIDEIHAGLRRSEVPEPSATVECPHWSPGRVTLRKGCTACAATAESQGEPSDALLSRIEQARGLIGLFRAWNVSPEQLQTLRDIIASAERLALRAAGGAR